VYSKIEYTTIIGQYVRPSGRLHDNFRKENQTEVKFSTQFSLIDISVEFEDDPNRLYHCSVTKEISISIYIKKNICLSVCLSILYAFGLCNR